MTDREKRSKLRKAEWQRPDRRNRGLEVLRLMQAGAYNQARRLKLKRCLGCAILFKPKKRSSQRYHSHACYLASPERSAASSATAKRQWADSEFRTLRSKQTKQQWATDEQYRQLMSKKIGIWAKKLHARPDHKAKMKSNMKLLWQTPAWRTKMSDVFKRSRASQVFPLKDSTLEVACHKILQALNIPFTKHIVVPNVHPHHQWDIVMPDRKLLVEVHGCYWHRCKICPKGSANPARFSNKGRKSFDSQLSMIRRRARRLGWKILIIWEHDIKSGKANVVLDKLAA